MSQGPDVLVKPGLVHLVLCCTTEGFTCGNSLRGCSFDYITKVVAIAIRYSYVCIVNGFFSPSSLRSCSRSHSRLCSCSYSCSLYHRIPTNPRSNLGRSCMSCPFQFAGAGLIHLGEFPTNLHGNLSYPDCHVANCPGWLVSVLVMGRKCVCFSARPWPYTSENSG